MSLELLPTRERRQSLPRFVMQKGRGFRRTTAAGGSHSRWLRMPELARAALTRHSCSNPTWPARKMRGKTTRCVYMRCSCCPCMPIREWILHECGFHFCSSCVSIQSIASLLPIEQHRDLHLPLPMHCFPLMNKKRLIPVSWTFRVAHALVVFTTGCILRRCMSRWHIIFHTMLWSRCPERLHLHFSPRSIAHTSRVGLHHTTTYLVLAEW